MPGFANTPSRAMMREADGEHLSIIVRLLSLPTVDSLAASHDRHPDAERDLVVLQCTDDDGVSGWGECSALNRPTYTAEWAEGAFAVLAEGDPSPVEYPMAAAAREMAYLDLRLKRSGEPLAQHLGADALTVPAGAAIGLLPLEELVEKVGLLADQGYQRVKVKIAPGHDVEPIRALAGQHPQLDLQVDANGAYGSVHLPVLRQLLGLGVRIIEQPFAPDNLLAAAQLQRDERATVVADEAVNSVEDAERLLGAGAMGGVAIKPPRLGGLAAAVAMHDWCVAKGIGASAGGMLEGGLGRHALAAVAALPGFTITGDLSPARRWLADDAWTDLTQNGATIVVPTTPGVAPEPDLDVLQRYTVRQAVRSGS